MQEIAALNIATKVMIKVDADARESGDAINVDFYNEALTDLIAAQKALNNEKM